MLLVVFWISTSLLEVSLIRQRLRDSMRRSLVRRLKCHIGLLGCTSVDLGTQVRYFISSNAKILMACIRRLHRCGWRHHQLFGGGNSSGDHVD